MARIFTSLLLTALLLDAGIAAPVPDKEAITLLLEAFLQEAYAEPHQAVQKIFTCSSLKIMDGTSSGMINNSWVKNKTWDTIPPIPGQKL